MKEQILLLKSEEEKVKIRQWLTGDKKPVIDNLTKDELINAISCCKNNLNEEISYVLSLGEEVYKKNLYISLLKSKAEKMNEMVKKYNESNTFNKYEFSNNEVNFNTPVYIETLNLEIDNFNYNYPMSFVLEITNFDDTEEIVDVIPYNYNGLFSEYLHGDDIITTYPAGNKNHIYFYHCVYNENGFSLGTVLDIEKDKDYFFDHNNKIVIENNNFKSLGILVKYQPSDNFYQISVKKHVKNIKLIVKNDFLKVSEQVKKRLVINS